jgi:DNA-binding LytR/AlgR family response regulator
VIDRPRSRSRAWRAISDGAPRVSSYRSAGVWPIEVSAIDRIQVDGDYSRVHVGEKSYLVSRSLTDLEGRLDAERLRAHSPVRDRQPRPDP